MMKKWIVFCILSCILVSCGKPDLSPRNIKETDKCVVCNMMIDHPEQAAQIVFKNEDHIIFDDVGCMMNYYKDNHQNDIGMMYVKDFKHNKWIDAKKAYFVYHKDIWTPMNYGVIAFKEKDERDEVIKQYKGAKILMFDDLKKIKWGIH